MSFGHHLSFGRALTLQPLESLGDWGWGGVVGGTTYLIVCEFNSDCCQSCLLF